MGGTPLLGGSWGPILQLDMENWIGFLEVLNLTYNILDFVQVLFFPDDLLNTIGEESNSLDFIFPAAVVTIWIYDLISLGLV